MTGLIAKIRNEIERNGAISFARFMELALYFPGEGFYERPRPIGRSGDFFTSVSVGNVFGELLAFQFADWFDECGTRNAESENKTLLIVEAGAHDAQLASDVLSWFQKFRPETFAKLNYCILEPFASGRDLQKTKLVQFPGKISWHNGWNDFPRSASSAPHFTIVFSNELFDAMPAHRIGWDAKNKTWFEHGVGVDGNNFIWKRLSQNQSTTIAFPKLAPELLEVLPDQFTTELCPAATQWWSDVARVVKNGKLVAIDYGLLAEEFFVPERSAGTLRAFLRHHGNSDLLANPGEQDLTAHVNFSSLKNTGESQGWKTDALVSQSKFLSGIFEKTLRDPNHFAEWTSYRRKQFQTLTHPEHLGRPFRVLIQSH